MYFKISKSEMEKKAVIEFLLLMYGFIGACCWNDGRGTELAGKINVLVNICGL